jgi:hypothetical protein
LSHESHHHATLCRTDILASSLHDRRARQDQTNSSASSQASELAHGQPAEPDIMQDVDTADAQLQREFDKRSSTEQAAVLNLVYFAQTPMNTDLNINPDKIGPLVHMLIVSIGCSFYYISFGSISAVLTS